MAILLTYTLFQFTETEKGLQVRLGPNVQSACELTILCEDPRNTIELGFPRGGEERAAARSDARRLCRGHCLKGPTSIAVPECCIHFEMGINGKQLKYRHESSIHKRFINSATPS